MAQRPETPGKGSAQQNSIAKISELAPGTINLMSDLLWHRDFCEHVTANRSDLSVQTEHTPPMQSEPRIRHAGAPKAGSGESGGLARRPRIPERRPFLQGAWQMLKNTVASLAGGGRVGNQISVLENVPQNSVSNLVKMVLLPILLIVIAVAMVPAIKEVANQTFYSIFYNAKLPDSRIATLKRISVGISLIFEHMVKKMFPVVRLRWMNRKLFKRRERILAPIPPVVPPVG